MRTARQPAAALLAVALLAGTAAADDGTIDPAVGRLVAELRARVDADPDDGAARGDLAVAYEANALWRDAEAAYAEAARLDPETPEWPLHHAIALRQNGDFAASLAALERVVERFPGHAPALQRLAMARLDAGETGAASAAFERLIDLAPDLPEGYVGLGDALLRDGNTQGAITRLETALRLDPGYRSAHYLLGQAYRAAGRVDEARRHLAFGQGAEPRFLSDSLAVRLSTYAVNLTARLDQASVELARRRPEMAAAILQSVRDDHPGNVTVLNNLAIAYMHRGDFDRARAELDRALELDPDKFSTYLNLSALGQRLGRPEEALSWADEAARRAPGVAQVHIHRAGTLLRLGRTDEAIESFERALETDFREQEPYLALANLELRRGNVETSLDYSRRALEVWPDLLPAHFLHFHASLELPDLEQARRALDTARLLAPDHPNLGELERLLDQAAEAERE